MVVTVIDLLEVVDVEGDDGDRMAVAEGPAQLGRVGELELALVGQAGQRILGCLALELFD